MADEPNGGNGQAPTQPTNTASGNGQAPTAASANNTASPSSGPNGQAPTATQAITEAAEVARMAQELAEARREAAKYRTELKARDDASLTDQQKRERDYADLQTRTLEQELRLQRLSLENAAFRTAGTLGIGDISAALALVQSEHSHEIEYEADGTPKNLPDLLKAVLKDHPILAAAAQAGATVTRSPAAGGATNPGRQAGNGGLTLEQIKAMTMRERMARMSEIDAWEKAQRQR